MATKGAVNSTNAPIWGVLFRVSQAQLRLRHGCTTDATEGWLAFHGEMDATPETLAGLERVLDAAMERRRNAARDREDADERYVNADAEIAILGPAVELLRDQLGVEREVEPDPDASETDTEGGLDLPWHPMFKGLSAYRGKPRLPGVIVRLLEQTGPMTQPDLLRLIVAHEPFATDPPSTGTYNNRVYEMIAKGDLAKHDDLLVLPGHVQQPLATEGVSIG
jgi:hypothetical protein